MFIHSTPHSIERRRLLYTLAVIGLIISYGNFVAILIFGILAAVKNDKKK
ncbi:putative holin-like toxin [Enterococcus sp. JM4C]|nr:putative holin-like toxin [Enterococcus sp. JM4C]KAF1296437.1 putative holin-like toxin [Enterococcus sp. JM4C]